MSHDTKNLVISVLVGLLVFVSCNLFLIWRKTRRQD